MKTDGTDDRNASVLIGDLELGDKASAMGTDKACAAGEGQGRDLPHLE
ncbi:hypothetical protein [Nocardia arthritidis]|nr:hypothetical protein [Nocardia arthritidis]